jgi:hypothetical protein
VRRKVIHALGLLLVACCVILAVENVYSDDEAVRGLARTTATKAAGCGDACKVTGLHGDRGMIHEEITYDIDGKGAYLVSCRRAFILAGAYSCVSDKP